MKGLSASLSYNEEVTLRRVAIGSIALDRLPSKHFQRLEQLKLIEAYKGGYQVTPLGRQRYDGLPRPAGLARDGSAQEIEQLLFDLIRSKENEGCR